MRFDISAEFSRWLSATRQRFHRIPEVAYQEVRTAAAIGAVLDEWGVPHDDGIGQTGIVARLDGAAAGPTVALRADIDALPLIEASGLACASEHPGVMHACGHDAHIAMALGVVRLLVERQWPQSGRGRIIFIFQPAEEGGAGAKAMLDSGYFKELPIDAIFAAHVDPQMVTGEVGIVDGPAYAATNEVRLKVTGRGGHGAYPHNCIDPIVAAAHLVTQIQTVVSRTVDPLDPAVVSICQFHGGTASNIIPETVTLEGTLRTLSAKTRELVVTRLREMVRHTAAAFDVRIDCDIIDGYPVTVNHPEPVRHARRCVVEVLRADRVKAQRPAMGAEDFAYFSDLWGGMMIQLGCRRPGTDFVHGLHSPHFALDEGALPVGVEVLSHIVTAFLEPPPTG